MPISMRKKLRDVYQGREWETWATLENRLRDWNELTIRLAKGKKMESREVYGGKAWAGKFLACRKLKSRNRQGMLGRRSRLPDLGGELRADCSREK